MSILYGKYHCARCGTAISEEMVNENEMIQWTEDTRFCEGDHCYLQTEDGKREIQDGDVTEEALENADDYDRRLREKALEEVNKKLKETIEEYKSLHELCFHHADEAFGTSGDEEFKGQKDLVEKIKELRERKKQLAKEV